MAPLWRAVGPCVSPPARSSSRCAPRILASLRSATRCRMESQETRYHADGLEVACELVVYGREKSLDVVAGVGEGRDETNNAGVPSIVVEREAVVMQRSG